jgi:dUTP pyrophosphatase
MENTKYTFYIKLDEDLPMDINKYYANYESAHNDDSGFDLPAIQEYIVNQTCQNNNIKSTAINFGIKGCMKDNNTGICVGYYLYPRSSFHKYPLIVGNHLGIIDAGYRGNIMGMVKPLYPRPRPHPDIIIKKNTKLFQICSPDLSPFNIVIINELPESSRGTGGFGSTDN